jgi:hypothetical protein
MRKLLKVFKERPKGAVVEYGGQFRVVSLYHVFLGRAVDSGIFECVIFVFTCWPDGGPFFLGGR